MPPGTSSGGGGGGFGSGGGGGMGGQSPTQQRQQQQENSSVNSAVNRVNSGGGAAPAAGLAGVVGGTGGTVYLGPKYTPGTQDYYDNLRRHGQAGVSNLSTVSAASGLYYQFDSKTKDKFLTQLGLAGVDVTRLSDSNLADLWGNYVKQAASYYGAGKTNISPWDILAKDRMQRESTQAAAMTPRTVTQTQTAYDLSTRADAQAIFYQAAQQLLGRDPTKKEVSSFQTSLNAYEKANPTVATTTSSYKGSELQSQTTTTKGGVKEGTRQQMALEAAKADPEYGAYQAATTYMDALMQKIRGG